jgi:SAM-dependent methyltransferase
MVPDTKYNGQHRNYTGRNMQIRRSAGRTRPGRDFSYNDTVGDWWLKRSVDRAHQRAYGNIANFIRKSIPHDPGLILDYACGAGNLLSLLCRRFPHSRLAGLDGSSLLLDLAEKRLSRLPRDCARRISLTETSLPGHTSLRERADLVVYCFPNMIPSRTEEIRRGPGYRLGKQDQKIARSLSRAREPGDDDCDIPKPQTIRRTLEFGRSVSKNLRNLLVQGGTCVRAEYATTRRHEWSPLELLQVSFEEGSLDIVMDGTKIRPWFRVLASAYFRSRVLEDVFEQTEDERDTNGGYLITILRAL